MSLSDTPWCYPGAPDNPESPEMLRFRAWEQLVANQMPYLRRSDAKAQKEG